MPKSLIAMVAVVVVVAAAASALTLAIVKRGQNEAQTGQQATGQDASPVNAAAADPRGRTLRRPTDQAIARSADRPAGRRHRRMSDGTPEATADASVPATGSTSTTSGTRRRSPGESTAEDAEQLRDARERSLYRLPSAWRIRALEASADESLHLTDAQAKEVDSVTKWLQEESKERLGDLVEEQQTLQGRLSELYRERAAIQKEIDGKFVEAIRGVMSPEQMAIIEGRNRAALPHPKDAGTP